MNRLLVLAISLLGVHEVSAQVYDSTATTTKDSVIVHKDPRVDLLVNKQIEINEFTTRGSRRSAPGFRILVISSNDRKKVIEAKTTMYREFPELKLYMMYQSPFFRLKVGNFREREEAEGYLSNIQRLFPSGVYVVTDTIEVRPELNQ
ncbi:MAG: SPOR domain-containing protein [Chitinophagaceae bacterium]|nr:SPOR domain-containing protein [Chitinophagaceae bacterium]